MEADNMASAERRLWPIAKSWRTGFFCALALFLFTRTVTLTAFPIFNDETLYLEYAQLIHADWQKDKFISMHRFPGEWKPPLQYWIAAPVIGWGSDPLLAGRSVALLVSLLGFFGFYFFAKELFDEKEGVIAAGLYALCPAVLFHNNQFVAETFLFSTAPCLYWALLKSMRPGVQRWVWGALAIIFGTALLLFKQSGFLLLLVSMFLPFARLGQKDQPAKDPRLDEGSRRWVDPSWNWKAIAGNLLVVVAVIDCAYFASESFLPSEFDHARDHFNSAWVMSWWELLELPTEVWGANLRVVADYISAYYSWAVLPFLGASVWFAWRRKSLPSVVLILMCLAGATGVTFLLRQFNEYIPNTAVVVFLLPLLARTIVLGWELPRSGSERWCRGGLLALAAVMLTHWSYQIILMKVSPGEYIERSTPWAATNYLHRWSTGFGVKEVVDLLARDKRAGVVLVDPQWGNPKTALDVYRATRFPRLQIFPISQEFLDPDGARRVRDDARRLGPAHYAIFSADPPGIRAKWQANVERELCDQRTEIAPYPGQMPIIVCQF